MWECMLLFPIITHICILFTDCTNQFVNKENSERLSELDSDEHVITAKDVWTVPPSTSMERSAMLVAAEKLIPSEITLKVGAQVVLLRNKLDAFTWNNAQERPDGQHQSVLVNGSRGVVIGFKKITQGNNMGLTAPVVQFDNGQKVHIVPCEWKHQNIDSRRQNKAVICRYQIPLKLAWALTVHKSQGSTLSRGEIMMSNAFDYGQAYTALSRVTGLDGLWLRNPLKLQSIKTHPAVIRYYQQLLPQESSEDDTGSAIAEGILN